MSFVSVPDPLAVPTWLTAIFTGVLGLFAVVTAWYARKAFLAQSTELAALHKDRRRDVLDRHRSRAALVYATAEFDPGLHVRPGSDLIAIPREAGVDLTVHNTGTQPVYDVRVHWVDAGKGSQAGGVDVLGTVPPGGTHPARRDLPAGTAQDDSFPSSISATPQACGGRR
jgi:hypothetical protein